MFIERYSQVMHIVSNVHGAADPKLDAVDTLLAALPAGNYKLVVEAAREVGGRELVSIPFTWPAAQATSLQAQGQTELGTITLQVKP